MTENVLEVIRLSCLREGRLLFSDISFQLAAGDMLLIEGQNGVGKSSLLRLTAGIATPFKGKVLWQKQPLEEAAAAYRKNLHYVGHLNGIKLGLTVIENLQLLTQLHENYHQAQYENILSLLQLMAYQHVPAHHLSAGQKRRLALAKLFLIPKSVWILDEPLTALDKNTQTIFLSQLDLHLQKGGIAIISSHHSIQLEKTIVKTLRLMGC